MYHDGNSCLLSSPNPASAYCYQSLLEGSLCRILLLKANTGAKASLKEVYAGFSWRENRRGGMGWLSRQ